MHTPKLECTRQAKADAYIFHPEKGPDGRRDIGWAICTVNDSTGELLITSDWGNMSHRWPSDRQGLGRPSLTHFLAEGDLDYMARKLLREGRHATEFSVIETTKKLKRDLLELRLDHGRYDRYPKARSYGRRAHLSKEIAREIWDGLDDLTEDLGHARGEAAAALYFERIPSAIHEFLSDLYERTGDVTTTEYEALTKIILPALVVACRETVELREMLAKAQRAEENRTP